MEIIIIGIILSTIMGFATLFIYRSLRKDMLQAFFEQKTPIHVAPPQVTVNLQPLEEAIKGIPTKVLQSIQSSANTKKGALGELIGYIELEAEYDRIIPLGNIVDFMCIKFPDSSRRGMNANGEMDVGRVDFVDIKTGKSSRLSKDQRELQKLIQDKKVNFVKVKVDTQTSESNKD